MPVNTNRGEMQVIGEILEICVEPVPKTRVMYRANLNFVQMRKYVPFLLEKGLLIWRDDKKYLITDKGMKYLKAYKEMRRVIE